MWTRENFKGAMSAEKFYSIIDIEGADSRILRWHGTQLVTSNAVTSLYLASDSRVEIVYRSLSILNLIPENGTSISNETEKESESSKNVI